ncbi:MAG: BamA/TamA family outer membrane protein [Rhodothermaceae bacterium]|nr:BamA/TamA family outer membrane protein [Rhodothermaceae bacterium]
MVLPVYKVNAFLKPLVLLAIGLLHICVVDSFAQAQSVRLDIFIDSEFSSSIAEATAIDSLNVHVNDAIYEQRRKGYYLAVLDSIAWNAPKTIGAIYIQRGPLLAVQHINIQGAKEKEQADLLRLMDTKPGQVLFPEQLSSDLDRILRYYETQGFPFAKIEVPTIQVEKGENGVSGIALDIQIEEGGKARLNDVLVIGAKRTRQSYIEYLIGLRRGDTLKEDLDVVRNKLASVGHFVQVAPIELIEVGGDDYIAVIQVQEDVPGAFDLVLGYQPPANNANNGGVVGNGHLDLRNMFGMGRRISLRLNRLPGQISTLEAHYADPYFWGSPLSIEGGFEGIQQDSTYNQQSYRAALGYRLLDGVDIFATINREAVRPGQSGVQLIGNTQRIARSEITFWGFSIRYRKIDSPANPRKGIHLETGVEGGRKRRSAFQLEGDGRLEASGDTTMSTRRLQQQRLNVSLRGYIPFYQRQVLVMGNDTRILVSDEFDTSDLFRLGGAQSLRGYDEERFRGRTVSRALIEWRYLFERTSYAYLFFDVGYVDRPQTADFEAERNIYPGYGLGMQFQTGIGLINTSLALSTLDSPSQAKVHVGLSFGL